MATGTSKSDLTETIGGPMYYEIVKSLLASSIGEIATSRNLSGRQALDIADNYLKTMSAEWFAGKRPTIAYEDPLCRWAYIYAHVAVHANCLKSVLGKCEAKSRKFADKMRQSDLSILTFGGGPGTELIALAKHFAKLKEEDTGGNFDQVEVEIALVDRVGSWSENINAVRSEIGRLYKAEFGKKTKWPARFNVFTHPLDVTNVDAFGNLPSLFKKQDVFIFNFMVSEIFELAPLRRVMRAMKRACADETYFLFVDRKDNTTKSKIDTLIDRLRLELVLKGETASYETVDGDEQKSVLNPISKYLKAEARHSWNACWRLAIKA